MRGETRFVVRCCVTLVIVIGLSSCGPSVEDNIENLGAGPDERAMARHELILAKEGAVEPIVAALESRDSPEIRPDLAEVLVDLLLRAEDERIWAVLEKHLLDDSDPRVRGRIADKLGARLRPEYFDIFLQAGSDSSPMVQAPILQAMSDVLKKLSDEQTRTLHQLARRSAGSEDREVREAALFLVEEFIASWAKEARQEALKANLSRADSIYNLALAYAPTSKQSNYYMGTFYLEYGDRERGLQLLRETRLLVDVPRFSSAPRIDGRLDDEVWEGAGRIDSFYVHFPRTRTTLQPRAQSNGFLGYTAEALYWGIRCFDAHPESLMVTPLEDKFGGERHDRVTFRFDRNLDKKTLSYMTVNSVGAVNHSWRDYSISRFPDYTWNALGSGAAHVGDDFWTAEFELRWDPKYHPRPVPGEISGIDLTRLFRTVEYSEAFRGYDDVYASGYALFQ